jgi:hypothetical protein
MCLTKLVRGIHGTPVLGPSGVGMWLTQSTPRATPSHRCLARTYDMVLCKAQPSCSVKSTTQLR